MTDPSNAQSWLRGRTRRVRRAVGWVVFWGLVQTLLLVAQAYLIARIVHDVVVVGLAPAALLAWFWAWLALLPLRAGAAYARERAGFAAGSRVRRAVREELLARLVALGPVRSGETSSGELASTVLERVEALEGYFAGYLPQRYLAGLVPLLILLAVYPLNWAAATLLLVTAPLIPLFMALVGRQAAAANQRQFQTLGRMSGHFLDRLRGLATLRLLDRADAELAEVSQIAEGFRVRTMAVLRIAFLSSTVLEFFSAVAIAMVAVYLGMALLGQLAFGMVVPLDLEVALFILLLTPEFYLPLRQLGVFYHARAEALGAAGAIQALLESEPPAVGRTPMPPTGRVTVAFEDVALAFEDGRRPALEGVSFRLDPGERVALIGASGAGKSTVVNLLLGFLQADRGDIRINGEPLTALEPASWRRHLAWIGQHPMLFHGSLRDNILLGREVSAARLEGALQASGVAGFLHELPAGLDTHLGEQGAGLSGGQAQRLALARALLVPTPLVVLDEPTASLDADTERWVLNALDSLEPTCTVLLVSHRLASIRRCQRVLVMERGRVVASGSHATLLENHALYRRLASPVAGAARSEV